MGVPRVLLEEGNGDAPGLQKNSLIRVEYWSSSCEGSLVAV